MNFIPLYYKHELFVVNPQAPIGIITLWTSKEIVLKKLELAGIDINPESSKIAVVGNLRGSGFPYLIRNLQYNPQISTLFIMGANPYNTKEDIISYFNEGVGSVLTNSPYFFDGINIDEFRIKGRTRTVDGLIHPEKLLYKPILHDFGGEFLFKSSEEIAMTVMPILDNTEFVNSILDRINIPLPSVKTDTLPSNPSDFSIRKPDIVSAWEDLVYIIWTFGVVETLSKGYRKELQNVKVVIDSPCPIYNNKLDKYWFTKESIDEYQIEMLSSIKLSDVPYTYGNRLREHFGIDTLQEVVSKLNKDISSRNGFISVWDTHQDMMQDAAPCLTTLFFRVLQNKLTLTATFRSHNSIDAWVLNIYAIAKLMNDISLKINIDLGALTIVSHSITIDMSPESLSKAKFVVDKRESSKRLYFDPRGNFEISIDAEAGYIVVKLLSSNYPLKIYRSNKVKELERQLYYDYVISDIQHALYIGRELARAEQCLLTGKQFIQK